MHNGRMKKKKRPSTLKLYKNRLQILVSDMQYRKLVTMASQSKMPMGAMVRLWIDEARADNLPLTR